MIDFTECCSIVCQFAKTVDPDETDHNERSHLDQQCLPSSYTPGIYAEGYIVFVFPFVCSFVRSYFLPSRGICVKVLR